MFKSNFLILDADGFILFQGTTKYHTSKSLAEAQVIDILKGYQSINSEAKYFDIINDEFQDEV